MYEAKKPVLGVLGLTEKKKIVSISYTFKDY